MPEQFDHTVLKPEEWQQYLQNAMTALRLNHNDHEALDAIRMANQALNAYDNTPAPSLGESVVGGIQGLKHLGANMIEGAVNQYPSSLVGNLMGGPLMNPVTQFNNLKGAAHSILAPVNVTKRAMQGEHIQPAEASESFAGAAATLGAPFVGEVGGQSLTKPLRSIGAFIERPILKNQLLTEQAATQAARTKAANAAAQRAPVQDELLQGRLKGQNLRNQATQQSIDQTAATNPVNQGILQQRLEMITQQLEQMPAGAERLGLTNELLRLRIQLLEQKLNGGGSEDMGGEPPIEPDQPPPPMPPQPSTPPSPASADRVQGQKGVTFGPETPLDANAQSHVKNLLGEIANEHGAGTMEPIPGAPKGFSAIGPEMPPARTVPKTLDFGSELMDILDRQRAKMGQHTPESIMGTDVLQALTRSLLNGNQR